MEQLALWSFEPSASHHKVQTELRPLLQEFWPSLVPSEEAALTASEFLSC